MTIVDDLLANTGFYLGIDTVQGSDLRGAARMTVTALPGDSGVSLDYEILNPSVPERLRGHVEHTMIARTHAGANVMVIGHPHANTVTILREADPGVFEMVDEEPFPMKVIVEVVGAGRIRHVWWYGRPGGEAEERDVANLERVG